MFFIQIEIKESANIFIRKKTLFVKKLLTLRMTLSFEKNASKRCQEHINAYHSVFVENESDILSYLDRNNANVLELMKKLEKNKQQQLSIDDSFAIAPKKRKLR